MSILMSKMRFLRVKGATYSWQVVLDPESFEVATTEYEGSKVLIDYFEECLGRRAIEMSSRRMGISSVAIYTDLL